MMVLAVHSPHSDPVGATPQVGDRAPPQQIRLRAKRRGHYEFPVVDDLSSGDTKERHRVYRRAQMQIDKILDPAASVPSVFIEPRKRLAGALGMWRTGRLDTGQEGG